jgi:hypothetical protein
MTKVVDYKYTLASFSRTDSIWLEVLEVFAKPYEPHPCFDDKNSYVGYYEIDDIMSFSPDSILERTRKNNKGKKGVLFNEPDYANCREQ